LIRVPAFEATTDATFKTPSDAMFATTAPEESLNCTSGAVAPDAALNTADSSLIVISGAVSNLKRAIILL